MRHCIKHTLGKYFYTGVEKTWKKAQRNNGLSGIWTHDLWNTVTNALALSYKSFASVPLDNLVSYNVFDPLQSDTNFEISIVSLSK